MSEKLCVYVLTPSSNRDGPVKAVESCMAPPRRLRADDGQLLPNPVKEVADEPSGKSGIFAPHRLQRMLPMG
jgi:hypothetical protein